MSTSASTSPHAGKVSILKNTVVFSLGETRLWTGRAKLKPEDFGVEEDQLPPEALASLGSKKIISPARIKPLQQIRYKMRRACLEVGTRFLGGFAVAVDEAESLARKLEKLVKEGDSRKATFLATFDQGIRDWHGQNPQWKHILSEGTPEKDKIGKRIGFGYHAFLVQQPANDNVAQSLLGAVDMMGNNLIDEIVGEARQFVKTSLTSGREDASQKTVNPIRRLARKMVALSYIDPALGSMASAIHSLLAKIPSTGKVDGEAFLGLTRAAYLLADPDRFRSAAQQLHDGSLSQDDLVASLIGPNAVDVAPSAVSVMLPVEMDGDGMPDVGSLFDPAEVAAAAKDAAAMAVATEIVARGMPPGALASPVAQAQAPVVDF